MKFKIDNIESLSDSREVLESKPNKFINIFIYILLALILSLLIWSWFSEKEIVVKLSGVVRPVSNEYAVSNIIPGEVTEIKMKTGEIVSKGDILLKIDSKNLINKQEQLNKQKEYIETDIENLKKFNNSINDNKNYFKDIKEEKEYYYKYKSYEAGNKLPLENTANLSNSKDELTKDKNSLEILNKSISDNKDYNQKNSIYSAKYENYITSQKIIENKLKQLEKAKSNINTNNEQEKKQLGQIELEIQNNEIQLSKLKNDAQLHIKESIKKIDENIKSIDNNLTKFNETTDITKEKNKAITLAQIEENINTNQLKLTEIEENLNELNQNIEKCTLKSPMDGKLDINSKLELGMMLQTGSIIANILPEDKNYRVDLLIPNNNISNIKNGQEIKYSFTSLPYREYGFLNGKVENISVDSKINKENGNSFYTGEGSLSNNSLYSNKGEECFIRPGMLCEATIITRKEKMLYYILENLGLKS